LVYGDFRKQQQRSIEILAALGGGGYAIKKLKDRKDK
jgi:hypothetical protein